MQSIIHHAMVLFSVGVGLVNTFPIEVTIQRGVFLNGFIYYRFKSSTIYQCLDHCRMRARCASINYRADNGLCHLNLDNSAQQEITTNPKFDHINLQNANESAAHSMQPRTVCLSGPVPDLSCIPEAIPCQDMDIFCPSYVKSGRCDDVHYNLTKYICRKSCGTCHLPPLLD